MALSVDTTPAKHVTVLRNGDNNYEGRRFIVSRRRYRTFDSLLSDITHQISAPFGAVRRLYTPKGRRQIRGIDDLEGGGTYIASGSERFKKLDYSPSRLPGKSWATLTTIRPGFLADDPPPLILPKKSRRYAQRSAQFYKVRQPIQFTVFRNGLPSDKGARFLLKSREMKSYETVLSIISLKIRLVEGAVRRLYTRDGASLLGQDDIVDGGFYVACGHRRFIPGPYGEVAPSVTRVQKLPAIKRSKEANQISPRTQSNPLPAIQRKAIQPKARSEKDSPAPIEEDKAKEEEAAHVGDSISTIPDMVTDAESADSKQGISKTEVNKAVSKKVPKPNKTSSIQSISSVSPAAADADSSLLTTSATDEPSVFNATAGKPGQDGNFLMTATEESGNEKAGDKLADEVEEDTDLVEDKPIELQKAEEVEEEEITKPNA